MTKRFDSIVAQHLAGFRIDLVDLALAILPHPQTSLRPRPCRSLPAARRGNAVQHAAGLRIYLVDLALADLVQMFAIEGGAGI